MDGTDFLGTLNFRCRERCYIPASGYGNSFFAFNRRCAAKARRPPANRQEPLPGYGTFCGVPPTMARHRANEISTGSEERHDKLKTCPTNGRGISFPTCQTLEMGGASFRASKPRRKNIRGEAGRRVTSSGRPRRGMLVPVSEEVLFIIPRSVPFGSQTRLRPGYNRGHSEWARECNLTG